MAAIKDKFLVRKKNVSVVANPEFIPENTDPDEVIGYFDVQKYQTAARVIDVRKGRGETYHVRDFRDNRVFIRHYWRGGMIGGILGDKFVSFFSSSHRSFREFDLLQTLRKMGLAVPKPVAAKEKRGLLFTVNDIVVQEIPGAKNLSEILTTRKLTVEEIAKVGDAVGGLFKAGVYHSDLNIDNILFDGAGKVWIVDFDKCEQKTISKKKFRKMVARLRRSFDKYRDGEGTFYWTEQDYAKLMPAIKSSCEKDF